MSPQRGFSLIETLLAVGVVALVALGAVGATMAWRATAVSTAASRFDALLDAARTTAREIDHGATIAFTPDAYGDGFVARLYENRPAAASLQPTTLPPLDARVGISETTTLGAPSFALAVHSNGTIAGIPGYTVGASAAAETACPASGAYQFVFSYAGVRAQRTVPCSAPSASAQPVAFVPPAAATTAPPPTAFPCGGSCVPTPPTSPNPNVTCPPAYVPSGPSSCAPSILTVTPALLTYTAPGSPAQQTVTVQENGYAGAFFASDTCAGAISYDAASLNGPLATYAVSALHPGTCAITMSDSNAHSAAVSVVVNTPPLQKLYVCDPKNPPRPYGTDIGPDPDGVHEDYSNGATCQPSPTPSPSPSPAGGVVAKSTTTSVTPSCTQVYADDWSCSWTDASSLSFTDGAGTSVRVTATVTAASNIANVTMALQYWNGSGFDAISIPGSWNASTATYSVDATVVTPSSSSTTYFVASTISCADDGYPEPQDTECTAGQNTYAVQVAPAGT